MRVLFDTNVLIEYFRNPDKRREFDARVARPTHFFSSVVAMELYAGCRSGRQEAELATFLKPFEKAGRVVTPDHATMLHAGRVIAHLSREGLAKAHLRQISQDVLIAVSAARAGVTVVTNNVRDFERIARWVEVQWITP
ncbi:MAG: type II toxin-antitoxin system VapC family toxin [Bryobacterales bacterium]|nr:type II toxin-antitoxin system VapC family toxin [Bryobacterales bacterium]